MHLCQNRAICSALHLCPLVGSEPGTFKYNVPAHLEESVEFVVYTFLSSAVTGISVESRTASACSPS